MTDKRGRGRPAKPPAERYQPWHITLPPDVAERIEAERHDGETDSGLIARLLRKATTMAFPTTQIWQHETSGERWLVRVNEAGEALESNGPVSRADAEYCVNEAGGEFDGTTEDLEWLAAQPFRAVYP